MSLPYSACIEVLFTERGPAAERVRAAAAAGFRAVEMWHWSSKDLEPLEDALRSTGVVLKGMVCEPLAQLVDPALRCGDLQQRPAQRHGDPVLVPGRSLLHNVPGVSAATALAATQLARPTAAHAS